MSNIQAQNSYWFTSAQGQGVLEYSLIGVLVLVVCVGTLEIFTGEMSKTWQKLWDDMKSRQGSAVAITSPSSPLPKSPSVDEGLPLTGKKFVTQKGTVIILPDTVDTMEETIKTLGANGTTTILANSLEALIKQLVASNELNKTQAQNLLSLANKGHAIAKLQKLTEDVIYNTRTIDEYRKIMENNPNVTLFDGNRYLHRLGHYDRNAEDPLQSGIGSYGATGEFLKAYHQAVASGALDDPVVRAVVDTLARKISNLSATSNYTFAALANRQIAQNEVSTVIAESIDKTHDSSAKICTTGNGQDSGTQCTRGG